MFLLGFVLVFVRKPPVRVPGIELILYKYQFNFDGPFFIGLGGVLCVGFSLIFSSIFVFFLVTISFHVDFYALCLDIWVILFRLDDTLLLVYCADVFSVLFSILG